jgi:microsomal dipeptidase-like Zn-dependent dipeptidase
MTAQEARELSMKHRDHEFESTIAYIRREAMKGKVGISMPGGNWALEDRLRALGYQVKGMGLANYVNVTWGNPHS